MGEKLLRHDYRYMVCAIDLVVAHVFLYRLEVMRRLLSCHIFGPRFAVTGSSFSDLPVCLCVCVCCFACQRGERFHVHSVSSVLLLSSCKSVIRTERQLFF